MSSRFSHSLPSFPASEIEREVCPRVLISFWVLFQYPYELVNLIGMQPDVPHLEDAPPTIRLPSTVSSDSLRRVSLHFLSLLPALMHVRPRSISQASVTQSPDAVADYSYMRSTLNAVPATNSLLNKSKLPLGLVITPYRSIKEGDVSSSSPLRFVTSWKARG